MPNISRFYWTRTCPAWKSHIQSLGTKLSPKCGLFYSLGRFMPAWVLLILFKSLIQSKLHYGILCWGAASKTALKPLQKLQHKVLRIIARAPKGPGCPSNKSLLKRFGVLNIEDMRKLEIAKFMYQFHCGRCPEYFNDFFTSESKAHKYNTRASTSSKYHMIDRKDHRSIKYAGPDVWNSIPPAIRQSTSMSTFKSKYKQLLLNKYSPSSRLPDHDWPIDLASHDMPPYFLSHSFSILSSLLSFSVHASSLHRLGQGGCQIP